MDKEYTDNWGRLYSLAVRLRVRAEATGSPELYRQAADAFREADAPLAAERMQVRAEYYERCKAAGDE